MDETAIFARKDEILLRDFRLSDEDSFVRWQTIGEWRYFDAPWEGILQSLSPEQEIKIRNRFKELVSAKPEKLCKRACISLSDGTSIGYINRYGNQRFPSVYFVGINICEDQFLNLGYGTIALQLWIEYLFQNSAARKIEIHTWSLNPRMIRVAENLGFTHEGTERELIRWQGVWQDRLRFGLLRPEWEQAKK